MVSLTVIGNVYARTWHAENVWTGTNKLNFSKNSGDGTFIKLVKDLYSSVQKVCTSSPSSGWLFHLVKLIKKKNLGSLIQSIPLIGITLGKNNLILKSC